MAARTPTDFTAYVDNTGFVAREVVTTTEPTNVINDQIFILEKNEIMIADVITPSRAFAAGAGKTTFGNEWRVYAPDWCGDTATTTCALGILTWNSGAANDYDVGVYHVERATTTTITVSANHGSKIWRGWTAITMVSDGTANTIRLWCTPHAVTNSYVAGLVIVTNQ